MSMEAILIATRNHLRTQLASLVPGAVAANAKHYVGIQPGGHPPASMGDWYIAVDEGAIRATERGFLHEMYGLEVVITRKVGMVPRDRASEVYYDEIYANNAKSLGRLERAVIVAIHGDQTLRAAANTWLGVPDAAVGDSIINPLWYAGRSKTRFEAGDWIGATEDSMAFMVRTLQFEGGRRIQALDVAG